MQRIVSEAIEDYLRHNISTDTRRLITKTRWDLYNGPLPAEQCEPQTPSEKPFPGFPKAVDEIRNNLDDIGTLYVDAEAGCWQTNLPEGYEDEEGEWVEPESFIQVEPEIIRRQLLGPELARYL